MAIQALVVPLVRAVATQLVKQKVKKAAIRGTRREIKKGLNKREKHQQQSEEHFKKLLERAKRTNARLIKYDLPPAALPVVDEYREAEPKVKTAMTKSLTRFVEDTPSDYNLRRAKEVRESGKKHGTRPAESTAIKMSTLTTLDTESYVNHKEYEKDENGEVVKDDKGEPVITNSYVKQKEKTVSPAEFIGAYDRKTDRANVPLFNLALNRFNVKLVKLGESKPVSSYRRKSHYPTLGIWRSYTRRLTDVFDSVLNDYGIVFANLFGKKLLDNWEVIENFQWEFESNGSGESQGFTDMMNILIKYAKETQEEYNVSVAKEHRKQNRYTQEESE